MARGDITEPLSQGAKLLFDFQSFLEIRLSLRIGLGRDDCGGPGRPLANVPGRDWCRPAAGAGTESDYSANACHAGSLTIRLHAKKSIGAGDKFALRSGNGESCDGFTPVV